MNSEILNGKNFEAYTPMRRLAAAAGAGMIALGLAGCSIEERETVVAAPVEVQDEASPTAEDALENMKLECDYDEMLDAYNAPPSAGETTIDENSVCDGETAVLRFGNNIHPSNVYVFRAENDEWRLDWNNSGGANLDCTPENMSEEIRAATPECEYNYE